MTESGARCLWVDQDRDEGVHHVCPDHAVDWVETETGIVPLCEVHARMAKEEGIATR